MNKIIFQPLVLLIFLLVSNMTFSQNLQMTISQNYDGAKLINWQKVIYKYDTNNYLISMDTQVWDDQSKEWQNNFLTEYINNSNGKMTYTIFRLWNNKKETWENLSQSFCTYNLQGNKLLFRNENWENNNWRNASQLLFTYDNDGNLINTLSQGWSKNLGKWENSSQENYSNANNILTTGVQQNWVNNTWSNSMRTNYSYTTSGKLYILQYAYWVNANWGDYARHIYNYDDNDFLINTSYQAADSNWESITQFNYTNNLNGTIDHFIWQNLNDNNWTDFNRMTYYYNSLSTESFQSKNKFIVYPNPTKDEIMVKSDVPFLNYFIIDQNGKSLFHGAITNKEKTIDVSTLTNGVYFIKLENQAYKFIKE